MRAIIIPRQFLADAASPYYGVLHTWRATQVKRVNHFTVWVYTFVCPFGDILYFIARFMIGLCHSYNMELCWWEMNGK